MSNPGPQQNPKKAQCDAYIALLKKISQEKNPHTLSALQKKANEIFSQFTPKMKEYCKRTQENNALEKQLEERAVQLEGRLRKLDQMDERLKGRNQELRILLGGTTNPSLTPAASSRSASNSALSSPSSTHDDNASSRPTKLHKQRTKCSIM